MESGPRVKSNLVGRKQGQKNCPRVKSRNLVGRKQDQGIMYNLCMAFQRLIQQRCVNVASVVSMYGKYCVNVALCITPYECCFGGLDVWYMKDEDQAPHTPTPNSQSLHGLYCITVLYCIVLYALLFCWPSWVSLDVK